MKHAYLIITLLTFSQVAVSQTCNDSIVASTPDSHFSVNGQEVTDKETGLIWQKCLLGQTGNDCSTGSSLQFNWSAALRAAEIEAQQTGKVWRLPNIKELRSIVEEKCIDPAINLTIFPNTISNAFWSASPVANYSNDSNYSIDAWGLGFGNGSSYLDHKSTSLYVRLVRKGQ